MDDGARLLTLIVLVVCLSPVCFRRWRCCFVLLAGARRCSFAAVPVSISVLILVGCRVADGAGTDRGSGSHIVCASIASWLQAADDVSMFFLRLVEVFVARKTRLRFFVGIC